MSFDIAIKIERLSKCYQIYETPGSRLKQFLFPRVQTFLGFKPNQYFREFWALADISFEIKRGEAVGIIGLNGSGKSTLLQLICSTLNPTSGTIHTNGRIAALLELGSGFNPEFTGRENIYMNAAILGLSKDEINAKFDKIVAFADIGTFIEQPVKTYSSGMYVRLAFAVIAHVDADILIIDEALSVGDAVFTQKCMRFLRKFMSNGTLLFVSHDINSVNNLCKKAVWLNKGKLKSYGNATDVTNEYIYHCSQEIYGNEVQMKSIKTDKPSRSSSKKIDKETKVTFFEDIANSEGWKTGAAEIDSVSIKCADGSSAATLSGGEQLILTISALVHQNLSSPIIGFFVKDKLGQSLFGEHTFTYTPPECAAPGDKLIAEFIFPLPLLPNGTYSMTVSIAEGDPLNNVQHHWLHDAAILEVQSIRLRYGLVGIPFDHVSMKKVNTSGQ